MKTCPVCFFRSWAFDLVIVVGDVNSTIAAGLVAKKIHICLWENTERPITVEEGSNMLIGRDMDLLRRTKDDILANGFKASAVPELWDGNQARGLHKYCQTWVRS